MSGGSDNVTKLIKEAAPYLARFYTILKQSGVDLNSVSGPTGELFLSYIRKVYTLMNIYYTLMNIYFDEHILYFDEHIL
jgi:hypothetical protein